MARLDLAALAAHDPPLLARPDLRAAAVLVPVQRRADGDRLTFVARAAGLRVHAGEIAFPGGSLDAADCDLNACALREAEEEVGLAPADVQPVGRLDPVVVGSGFLITPFVGVIPAEAELHPSAPEIDRVLSLPLARLMHRDSFGTRTYERAGVVRISPQFVSCKSQV